MPPRLRRTADWAACSSPQSYSSLADGAHSFEVRAIDQAGNADQSADSFEWSIDTTAPDTQITVKPAALTNSASASFSFTGSDAGGSGVASFQCRRDSAEPADWAACSSPKSYSSLADGAHSFEVRAIDNAGNADQSADSFEWTIDTAPPLVAIDSLSKSLLKAGQSSEVSWHANENGAFSLRLSGSDCDSGTVLDSGAYGSQPASHISNVSAADLSEGANTLRLCLSDAAANRGADTETINKDTDRPRHPDHAQTGGADQQRLGLLQLQRHRHRRLRRRLLPVPPRLRQPGRLGGLQLADKLQLARRRRPQLRSAGDRPGRQRRPERR